MSILDEFDTVEKKILLVCCVVFMALGVLNIIFPGNIIGFITGVLMFLHGVAGVYGVYKGKDRALKIFTISNLVLAALNTVQLFLAIFGSDSDSSTGSLILSAIGILFLLVGAYCSNKSR
eukprot:TRINITY_DN211_c0_g2_i1.p1 TRINITY_DN211_c0_g2~~TRINITY_DN211_c0_g2_i1.p1  ORF type:complete len:120 (-),score=44.46 TRINITY_DN211_c0_g2_i1:142-501(-)